MPQLAFLDDNVLDPISRKGQDDVYVQLEDLLASIDSEFEKGFEPCFSIEAFFERLGKEGDFWKGFDIYKNLSIPRKTFEDLKKVADAIEGVQNQLVQNIKNEKFFAKENLKYLYETAKQTFVGNHSSTDLLNLTFNRYGNHLFDPNVDHWPYIIPDLVWDRLVAFPMVWKDSDGMHGVPESEAQQAWECAEKFYNCLLAGYRNQNVRLRGATFTRLTLQRYFVFCILSLKILKNKIKKTGGKAGLIRRYQMQRLKSWVDAYRLAFKKNSDLLDVRLLHCALYGFVKENGDKKRIAPGVCVTCDPIGDIEARLSLCVGAHKTLTEQVNGWDLPLCPGRIICLKYEGMKFVHVKTIDVQRFVTEYYSFKHKWTSWLFNAKLFCRLFFEEVKRWFGVSK